MTVLRSSKRLKNKSVDLLVRSTDENKMFTNKECKVFTIKAKDEIREI